MFNVQVRQVVGATSLLLALFCTGFALSSSSEGDVDFSALPQSTSMPGPAATGHYSGVRSPMLVVSGQLGNLAT